MEESIFQIQSSRNIYKDRSIITEFQKINLSLLIPHLKTLKALIF